MSKPKNLNENVKPKVDMNLPEDERNTKFQESKIIVVAPKKRPVVRPVSGVDRIRIISRRKRAVDVHARFNYAEASFERNFTVALPKRLDADRHIIAELKKLYLKMMPDSKKILVPDSLKVK